MTFHPEVIALSVTTKSRGFLHGFLLMTLSSVSLVAVGAECRRERRTTFDPLGHVAG